MYTYLHSMGDTTKEPCHVPFCRHREGAEGCDCTFIRFPLDRSKRNQWIQEIGAYGHLEKQPTYLSKICSCHFENGDSSKLPSMFPWTEHPEHYTHPPNDRAKRQIAARKAARLKASLASFETEKSKVNKDTVFCDSIVLTFDTSEITGNSGSLSMSVGNISKCELVNEHPLPNGVDHDVKCTEHKSTQTSAELLFLKTELDEAKKKLEKLSKNAFGVQILRGKEEYFKFYTGVGENVFNRLVNEVRKHDPLYRPKNLSIEDEILLTLMKLRLNTGYVDLTIRFNIAIAAICPIITRHINTLHTILFLPMRNYVAINDSGSHVELTTLKRQHSIINCTNIVGESALADQDCVAARSASSYKGNFKVVMGVTSNQVVTYCSNVFQHSMSREQIYECCDLHEFIKPGDIIVNDRTNSLLKRVLKDDAKVAKFAVDDTEIIEKKGHLCFGRTMKRLRNYQILPCFPQTLYKLSTKILQLCVALTNYQNPHFWKEEPTNGIEAADSTELLEEEHVEIVVGADETEEIIVTGDIQMDDEELIELDEEF